jgi:hypothetical protein
MVKAIQENMFKWQINNYKKNQNADLYMVDDMHHPIII